MLPCGAQGRVPEALAGNRSKHAILFRQICSMNSVQVLVPTTLVVAVASPGEVRPVSNGGGADINSFARLGDVSVTAAGLISSAGAADGGAVAVSGASVTVD